MKTIFYLFSYSCLLIITCSSEESQNNTAAADIFENIEVFDDVLINASDATNKRRPPTNGTLKASSIMNLAALKPMINSTSADSAESVVFLDDSVPVDSSEKTDETIYENSENNASSIAGSLMSKLLPEILKYNGRMILPSTMEDDIKKSNVRRDKEPLFGEEENEPLSGDATGTGTGTETGTGTGYLKQVVASVRGGGKSVSDRSDDEKPFAAEAEQDGASSEEDEIAAGYKKEELRRNVSEETFSNSFRLEDSLDLYNPYRLLDIWRTDGSNRLFLELTSDCRLHTETFLISLEKATPWALKSELCFFFL